MAKLCEQAERYDEMVDQMGKVAKMDVELTVEERNAFRDFRCRDARCFKPADRAYVLQAIREEWGTEEAFNRYVQTKLPEVLASSKRAYSRLFARELQSNVEHMFGD